MRNQTKWIGRCSNVANVAGAIDVANWDSSLLVFLIMQLDRPHNDPTADIFSHLSLHNAADTNTNTQKTQIHKYTANINANIVH